jgi:hypothetical protein
MEYGSLVVIDVELCIWIDSASCFKGNSYEVLADNIIEYTAA